MHQLLAWCGKIDDHVTSRRDFTKLHADDEHQIRIVDRSFQFWVDLDSDISDVLFPTVINTVLIAKRGWCRASKARLPVFDHHFFRQPKPSSSATVGIP